jgi:hypothetical protein
LDRALAVFRPSNGTWYVKDPLTGQFFGVQWGQPGDVPIARAHFDYGPGNDIAVYRPSNQTWYILTPSSGFNPGAAIVAQLGAPGDIPIFNNDFSEKGHDDFAVFRPSNGTWYVKDPITGTTTATPWGTQGDVPLAGWSNYGHQEFAVYRPSNSTWYIKDPLSGWSFSVQWGNPGDEPLANANFGGGGESDIAVFRPSDGTWHVLTSASGFNPLYQIQRQWGASGDEAVSGPDCPDPITNTGPPAVYRSFLGDPLFVSDGPIPEDVMQGAVGDCQFLAALLGIARDDPARIRQSIADMGNGLYAVDFGQGAGAHQYVVVDANLPIDGSGNLVFAKLGHQNSLWVALLEKAWTFARPTNGSFYTTNLGTYNMINGGGPGELLGTMGSFLQGCNADGATVLSHAEQDYQVGREVAVCTNATVSVSSGLIGAHCYFVNSIQSGRYGLVTITLRNPWGGSDEFITVSASDFEASFWTEASACV